MAILRSKSELRNAHIHGEVLEFIARQLQNNIRELEGGLTCVLAHASLMRMPVSLDLARQALAKLVSRPENLTLAAIVAEVARYYSVSETELLSRSRHQKVAQARQVVMYLSRDEINVSLPKIGEALGGRDHTTVMHGIAKIANQIETDDALRRDIMAIRERVYKETT
jgi:chromosomal replication initiator protein